MADKLLRGFEDEELAYFTRKARELSKIKGAPVTVNEYMKMALKKFMRDDLSIHDDKISIMNEKLDELTNVIGEYVDSNNKVIALCVDGGIHDGS
jgi:hypothetical protein